MANHDLLGHLRMHDRLACEIVKSVGSELLVDVGEWLSPNGTDLTHCLGAVWGAFRDEFFGDGVENMECTSENQACLWRRLGTEIEAPVGLENAEQLVKKVRPMRGIRLSQARITTMQTTGKDNHCARSWQR